MASVKRLLVSMAVGAVVATVAWAVCHFVFDASRTVQGAAGGGLGGLAVSVSSDLLRKRPGWR